MAISTFETLPTQEQAKAEQAKEQESVEKQVMSHVVPLPSSWKGGIPLVFPAQQLSVRYRHTTELSAGWRYTTATDRSIAFIRRLEVHDPHS